MGQPLKVFDPDKVACNFAGIPLKGFADGEFVRIEQQEDSFNTTVGSDGQTVRVKSNNYYTVVTITLLQSSDSNPALSAVATLDEAEGNGAGVGALSIVDLQGTTVFLEPEAWIIKRPDVTFDREATTREWQFGCPNPNLVVGNKGDTPIKTPPIVFSPSRLVAS